MAELAEEFSRIARYFAPLAGDGAFGLTDDAALLIPPAGRHLVMTADAIVAGVHFLPEDPPDLVARKLLRVNLSDLAAMGAVPLAYLLTISVPVETTSSWFSAFASGLALDQREFAVRLLGGDTTNTPGPVSLSATLIGHVAPGQVLRRAGAKPGDGLWVTGTIGDAALGLRSLQGKMADPTGYLADRYRLPQPRLGLDLHGVATACLDISDGLLQDAMHLCRASGCAVEIDFDKIPLSDAARTHAYPPAILTGGDDYELLFAAKDENVLEISKNPSCAVTKIGEFRVGRPGVTLANCTLPPGAPQGWSHF